MSALAGDKQERLAKVYDGELLPVYGSRFADLILRRIETAPATRIVEVGCATGYLTAELARKFDGGSSVTAFEESPALLERARAKLAAETRVSLEVAPPAALPLPDGAAHLVVSNLVIAEADDPRRAMAQAARVLAPGGRAAITAALRGTWVEFLDIYRDVLQDNGKRDSLAALDRYLHGQPDADAVARWLEQAGLVEVEVSVERWEILFRSAREFFFAPLIELGPLPRWKQLAGRGEEMQDIFFFAKEAIDAYFKGTAFPVTVVGAVVTGRKSA